MNGKRQCRSWWLSLCNLLLSIVIIVMLIGQDKLYWFSYQEKDYLKIRDHIMEEIELSPIEKWRLDVNNDGVITSLDYVMIRNRIELKGGKIK